jgi:hypothetical protein
MSPYILFKKLLTFTAALYVFVTPLHPSAIENDFLFIRNGTIISNEVFKPEDDCKTIAYFNQQYKRYTDYANGFQLNYPQDMKVDYSLSIVRTTFANTDTSIEVFYDNFSGTVTTADNYIHYGNRFIANSRDHTLLAEESFQQEGAKVHTIKWVRRKLARVPNDKNYYACAEISKNNQEIYTLLIKSTKPILLEKDLIDSFQFFEPRGSPRTIKKFQSSRTLMNEETKSFYQAYFSPEAPLRWGLFEPLAPENIGPLSELEKKLHYKFNVLLDYQSLDEELPEKGLANAYAQNRYVELTFYTAHDELVDALSASGYPRNASIIYDILDGNYDDYLERYAKNIKAFGHPVLFRLNNEMNGDWCWYSAFYTSKDADIYKALWRYVHHIFDRNGVDNVLWVWNPHDVSKPDFKWNHCLMYYPGDEYVDVIGLTGYNTGTYYSGEEWREFAAIYTPLYEEYSSLFNKPFMISEFGSNSVGGNKVAWINRMMNDIKHFPAIKIAIWWNGTDFDKNRRPARIYRLDETPATIAAFSNRLQEFQ